MKRIIKILLVMNLAVITLLIFSSCQDATISPYQQPIPTPIIISDYPLEPGNYWKYLVTDDNNRPIDTMLVSIISKYQKNVFDTTIYEYAFTQKYFKGENNHNNIYFGKIFNYNSQIFSTQDNKIVSEKPLYVRLVQATMYQGLCWSDVLYKDLQGLTAIEELRKVEAKIDTVFNNINFRNCYRTSKYWLYHSQGIVDTIKVGTEIYCPSVGMVYQDESVDTNIYEKRVILDFKISIK
jgi:hypothetical protein